MLCDRIDAVLDRWMDGELSRSELDALEAHAKTCEACANKLRAARQLKAMLTELAPEVEVPIQAQAQWRRAIRDEAKGAHRRSWIRYAGGIAAGLAVLVCAGLLLKPAGPRAAQRSADALAMGAEEAFDSGENAMEYALLETDGVLEAAEEEAVPMEESVADAVPMREYTLDVEDLDDACSYIGDLAEEYEGSLREQRFDDGDVRCANLYLEMQAENAADFLASLSHYGHSNLTLDGDTASGHALSLLLVLREN